MRVSIDVFLPEFSKDTIAKAVAILADQKLKFEFDQADINHAPHAWSGFKPIIVTISGLRRARLISQKFETGFEIDVAPFSQKEQDPNWAKDNAHIQQKLQMCTTIVTLTISDDLPAAYAIANCFAAALAEAADGIAINCQVCKFDNEIQSVASVLQSDLVEEFDQI